MTQTFQDGTLSVCKVDAITYLHAALEFPMRETLLTATRAGFLALWSELNVTAINKNFPESVEMQKGHMKHQRQDI